MIIHVSTANRSHLQAATIGRRARRSIQLVKYKWQNIYTYQWHSINMQYY